MPYCVNCGVELDNSADACALCATPVILPGTPTDRDNASKPYSDKIVLPASDRRRFVAFLISVIILIPNIVSGLTNFLIPRSGIWSVYVIATSVLLWVLFVQPFLWKKIHVYTQVVLDAFAVVLYMYVFYAVGNEKGWFYLVALPMVIVLEAQVLCVVWWLKHRPRDWPQITIVALAGVAVYGIFTDLIIHRFLDGSPVVGVSVIIAVSCLALIGFFIAVMKNRRLRAWLGRKFFL